MWINRQVVFPNSIENVVPLHSAQRSMLTIDPKEIPVSKLHHYLLGSVGPRPIAFASTIDAEGNDNLAPFSFFNVFSANPPIMVFSPARSGRSNETKDTYKNVKSVPEVVINIVNYDMVQQMSLASSPFASDVSEFEKAGFTALPSETIRPKRVAESPVQFECKVIEVKELGAEGGAGNLVICEVLRIHINEEVLNDDQMVDQHKIELVARMGGNWYCKADSNSMFEITKPIMTVGIGFDSLPEDVIASDTLTGNDLGQLAGIEELPNETDVNEYKLIELSDLFVSLEDQPSKLEKELHVKAKQLLADNKLDEAWMTLLAFNNG
ncbi:MAG: flavin reductase (DIM6/NTAB) family NADH-FMN oxidoreductase RutF [Flavobacteriaceae bacterium]|jgi:flavin reductase (DIM6/NTAB) family NADH-FMN oxidoreductase RutF